MRRALPTLAFASALLAAVGGARASEGEVVTHLALFTISGDRVHDALARELGEALRHEVRATPGHQLSDARASLEQLSLVHDCDPEQQACLATMGKQLGVSGFIFGRLQSEGGGAYAELSLFDVASQSTKRTARATFGRRDASAAEIERKAKELVRELLAPPPSQPAAAPPAGVAPAPLELPAVAPAPPAAEGGLSTKRIAGYALLGGAALSAGLSVLAFVQIDGAESNASLGRYRRAVGQADPAVEDVCDEAQAGRRYGLDQRSFDEVKSECGTGRTFEVLQFVFLGAAAVSGGLSAYMFLSDDSGRENEARALLEALPLRPVVRHNAAEIRAKLRF